MKTKVITLNGKTYIGEVKDDGAIINALEMGENQSVTEGALQTYIKAANAGNLTDLDVLGNNVTLTIKSFTDRQRLAFKSYKAAMKLAKKTAIPKMENSCFDDLVKK